MIFCNKCGIPMSVDKNGVMCVVVDSEKSPYQAFMGDRYKCQTCGSTIILTNQTPAFESFQKDFYENLHKYDEIGLLVPPYYEMLANKHEPL